MVPDVLFCDQTLETTLKATAKSKKVVVRPNSANNKSSSPGPVNPILTLWNQVPTDHRQCFLSFFVTHHIANPEASATYMTEGKSPLLNACGIALGAALLSITTNDASITFEARKHYVRALSTTNAALRDPDAARRDETLLAVLLLTSFETIAGEKEPTLAGWTSHVDGATSLLLFRGPEQFRRPGTRFLFAKACILILTVCVWADMPVPRPIRELYDEMLRNVQDGTAPIWQMLGCSMDFTDLCSELNSGVELNPNTIITKALAIDGRYVELFGMCKDEWTPEVCGPAGRCVDGLPLYYNLFSNRAALHQTSRIAGNRLMLHDTILRALRHPAVDPKLQVYCDTSLQTCLQLQRLIVASIPQDLGFRICPAELDPLFEDCINGRPERLPLAEDFVCQDRRKFLLPDAEKSPLPIMLDLGGYGLLWSLVVVGISDTSTRKVKLFVKKLLWYLGVRRRIAQASVLVAIVAESC